MNKLEKIIWKLDGLFGLTYENLRIKPKRFIIGLVILSLIIGVSMSFVFKNFEEIINKENKRAILLEITQACEDGCVMSQGLNYEDLFLDTSDEINNKIALCIFKCNDRYYYDLK